MTDEDITENNTDNGHPAWASLLDKIPSQFHNDLRPELEAWDKGVQDRFQQVHSDYADWKSFKDAGIKPDQVNSALGFVTALESNPIETLEALQTYYRQQGILKDTLNTSQNSNQQQGQPDLSQEFGDIDPKLIARIQQYEQKTNALEQQNTTLAQVLLKQQEAQQARIEDEKLNEEFTKLHEAAVKKYGYDFNERAVIGYAKGLNIDLPKAMELYYSDMTQNMPTRRPAPNILGPGGNLPSNQQSLRGKTPQEVDNIAIDFLRGINQRGQL